MDQDDVDERDSEDRSQCQPVLALTVPKIPPEFGNQRLLICLETALRRIHLLQVVPHLCVKVVAGDDANLEGILGSVCIKTILKLFATQVACFESKAILSRQELTERETDQQLLNSIKNSLTLSSGSGSEQQQPPSTHTDMDEAFSRKGAIQFDSPRSRSLSSDGDGTRFTEEGRAGQLVVYDQDMIGGQRAPDADVTVILDSMKRSYRQLLQQLESNTRFLVWVQENADEIGHDYRPGLKTKDERRLSTSFTAFQVSEGFLEFKSCMYKLYDVVRRRLLVTFEEYAKSFERSREFWIRERVYNEEASRLHLKLEKLQSSWESKRREYDEEIAMLQLTCDRLVQAGFLQCRGIVKKSAVDNLMTKKTEGLKAVERHAAIVELERSQAALETQHKSEIGKMRASRKMLQDRLTAIIATYDSEMLERQAQLDDLQNQERMNDAQIKSLKQMVEDTQEQFEEMRNTKKLKEILRNIAMADNFRENRAARIIQMAWRRYKYRKLRKLRRKGRIKRKPKSEEVWKQLGFMTYCTPQDHVRALQQKKAAETGTQKQKHKKSKKPFKVHTGSSFRSRQSSSISLFLL